MRKNLVYIFILIIIGYACSSEDIQFDYKMISDKMESSKLDSLDQSAVVEISFPVISFNNQQVEKSIQDSIYKFILGNQFENHDTNSHKKIMEQFVNEYKDFKKEFPDYQIGWYLEKNVTPLFYNDRFISLEMSVSSFTGGAHPNSAIYFSNYDLISGKVIALTDIVNVSNIEDLIKIAEKKFRLQKGIKHDEPSLSKAGYWFKDDKFQLNNNFALNDKGITFYFNSYEIAPYAMGATELFLSFNDIGEVINKSKYNLEY